MSNLLVTAEQLTIMPHPNADALELAQVGLYRAVVGKGVYRTGDYALYIPEQAILPDELIEELGLTGRLAGSAKNRVKAVRLRGELSQGIVCRPKAADGLDLSTAAHDGVDFSEQLGITKWVPEIPVSMAGTVIPGANLIKWIEIENLKRFPSVFQTNELVTVSEKIHGTCCLLTYVAATDDTSEEVLVTSKGRGDQYQALADQPDNLYWRAVHGHGVPGFAAAVAKLLGAVKVGVFGEVYGAGVQDLGYGANAKAGDQPPGYAIFDACWINKGGSLDWLEQDTLRHIVNLYTKRTGVDLAVVPQLYEGAYDEELILALAQGRETISGKAEHIREGVVVRAVPERRSDVLGGRAIVKVISDDYLTRKGGTEYQ